MCTDEGRGRGVFSSFGAVVRGGRELRSGGGLREDDSRHSFTGDQGASLFFLFYR